MLLVHAAGTGERGAGIVGAPLARSLAGLVQGATVEPLDYNTSAEYVVSVAAGARAAVALLVRFFALVSRCI